MKAANRVGVREMRQNLSVYLARVMAGDTLEVTDRGHPVAVLAPLPHDENVLTRLRREGRLIPASAELMFRSTPRRARARHSARALMRERADRAL